MTRNQWPLLFAGILCLTVTTRAATATNTSSDAPVPSSILDNDEMTRLQKVRAQVLTAHPDLKAEEVKLKALHDSSQSQNPPPTAEQRNANFAEWKAYQKQMRAEMLKIDPTLKPLFAKLDDARKHGSPAPFQPAAK